MIELRRIKPLRQLDSPNSGSLKLQTEKHEKSLEEVIIILLSRSCYLVGTQRNTVFAFVTHIRTADSRMGYPISRSGCGIREGALILILVLKQHLLQLLLILFALYYR